MDIFFTVCFYLITMVLTCFFTKKAVDKNDIRWLLIPVILLSLVAGLRSFDVGTDTHRVVQSIEYTYEKGIFSHSKEYIYYFLCKFLMIIWKNPSFVLTVFALITNALVFIRLWDFKDNINIVVATSIYFLFYFGLSMNIVRQCMAIAIVFYATRFIEKKNYKFYFLGVFIAFLVHISSCVAIVIPVIYLFFEGKLSAIKQINKKYIFIVVTICIVLGSFLIYKYAGYFSEFSLNIGLMQTVCLLLLLGSYFLIYMNKEKIMKSKSLENDFENLRTVYYVALLGHVIAFLGYMVPALGRLGYTFKLFEIVYYGMLMKKSFYSNVVKASIYGMLLLLGFYSFMTYGGIVPYAFIGG
ncbi:EpsG family protein [Floccifex sp.]|uniref:EpsG family protein n=1 Tax=Floccifex sp. TaxID=2815810 RepID=UPI002A748947|nr:EpsG family protein [Floccifex sp.]MDD7282120.1 EpsG family protein [Erysipelotrichaceae bacterium]MDY2957449.1 EpsG family protein [Floccifex sp.]